MSCALVVKHPTGRVVLESHCATLLNPVNLKLTCLLPLAPQAVGNCVHGSALRPPPPQSAALFFAANEKAS